LKIIFLGTGGSVPTKDRNLPCVLLRRDGELLMFDCGEGTQKQILRSKVGINRGMKIFISHMHADHVLGLPGLLHSMSFLGRRRELDIYGPAGIEKFVTCIAETVGLRSEFKIKTHVVTSGRIVDEPGYEVYCARAVHSIPCIAYSVIEKPRPGRFYPSKARRLGIPEGPLWSMLHKGRSVRVGGRIIRPDQVVGPQRRGLKFTYAVDTRPSARIVRLAEGSDLLVHDSSFSNEESAKAVEYKHSTASEAARLAKQSKSKRLVLFHLSAMYQDPSILLKQARAIFRSTILAEDMLSIDM
jgi:ribonuclease Z